MLFNTRNISIVILAGGRGSRVAGIDKGLMLWQGKPLIEHILPCLPKSSPVFINANRNLEHYQQYGVPVIADTLNDFQGPLAGILSVMQQCQTDYLLCIPCDTPQPPLRLAERLMQCLLDSNASAVICHDGERVQPLFALMSCTLQQPLASWLASGQRKAEYFFRDVNAAVCDFADQSHRFNNFNTPEDMT